jgi:transposase-like protein
MRGCKNVKELAKELGIHRNLLYSWRDQLSPQDRAEWEEREAGIQSRLERENRALKQALAEKTLEVDFSEVPCKKSRLVARTTAKLARRHLRRNQGVDVDARQIKHRAHVPAGGGEPGWFLSIVTGAAAARG